MVEKTHDGADARTTLAECQLVDHPKNVTPLCQHMGLSLNLGHHWDAMTLRPKHFSDVGSPMNVELAKDASIWLRAEAVVSGEMHHKVSYDWGLLIGCSPNPIPEYYTEGYVLDVEEPTSG